ncbi:MAG: YcaQ family DNA glycosylase [Verrucomicrobia bacterium]|nr:YcaQ family DNA glycosylase [Verrucomicrobiota bacterium]
MLPATLDVTVAAARRFMRRALLLDTPAPDVATALAHHGYIQIDPINICGRMHDLILRNRVAGYREGDLMRHLHGGEDVPLPPEERTAFEHHLPHTNVLVAFPLEAWPHLPAAMEARTRRAGAWSCRLTPRERALVDQLLEEIGARGPLGSADFEDRGRARRVWGQTSLVKSTLQKLFFHGRLLIAKRANNHRRYDLPERVLPRNVLSQPPASAAETAQWIALLKLRQFRLALLKREEANAAAEDIQPVEVEGCPLVYCLKSDAPALTAAEASDPQSEVRIPQSLRLLAPLDPVIYQRRLTSALWHFDYTWEAYTPAAKRARGYFALPILAGTELVGHVDPKADREARRLRVLSRRLCRGHSAAPAVRDLARWLGLR